MMRATFGQKWLRIYANLALFAMLAVWTSPALAWHCCCAPTQGHHAASASRQVAAGHSCCEDTAPKATVQNDCDCESSQVAVVALPNSVTPSLFAALDFASVPSQFALTFSEAVTTQAFFTRAARPPT